MIFFRQMTPDDADEVAEIEERSFSVPWSRRDFWEEASNENTFYFVAVEQTEFEEKIETVIEPEYDGEEPKIETHIEIRTEKKVVGYIGAWLSFTEAQITNVAIDPDHRHRGIGEAMIREFLARIKEYGINAATLEVRPSNTVAIHLYQKIGFRSVGRRPRYYLDNNEDALIMWLTKI